MIAIFSFYNYEVKIHPKYAPINQASNLIYDASQAHTAEEKTHLINEAWELYYGKAQIDTHPLMIELRSLSYQNATDEFRKVSNLLSDEYEEWAFGPYTIPAGFMMFAVIGSGYLALGKYKDWNDRHEGRKIFAFTLMGTLELCLLLLVVF